MSGFVAAPGADYTHGDEPKIARILDALGKHLGVTIVGTSGYRSIAQQQALQGHAGPVAAPGKSQHQFGRASDATIGGRPFWQVVDPKTAAEYGLGTYAGGTTQDPVHVELATASNIDKGRHYNLNPLHDLNLLGDQAQELGKSLGEDANKALYGKKNPSAGDVVGGIAGDIAAPLVHLLFDAIGKEAAPILLTLLFVIGGAALFGLGIARTFGLNRRPQEA